MPIIYSVEPDLAAADFRDLLIKSTLAARRPADDLVRLEQMLQGSDLVVTARDGGRLVGLSRAVTDFSYCCYLSDLAVDAAYQHQGIGRTLVRETHVRAGEQTTLILIAAPAAEDYYSKIGMTPMNGCWVIPRLR